MHIWNIYMKMPILPLWPHSDIPWQAVVGFLQFVVIHGLLCHVNSGCLNENAVSFRATSQFVLLTVCCDIWMHLTISSTASCSLRVEGNTFVFLLFYSQWHPRTQRWSYGDPIRRLRKEHIGIPPKTIVGLECLPRQDSATFQAANIHLLWYLNVAVVLAVEKYSEHVLGEDSDWFTRYFHGRTFNPAWSATSPSCGEYIMSELGCTTLI